MYFVLEVQVFEGLRFPEGTRVGFFSFHLFIQLKGFKSCSRVSVTAADNR